jgi:hypothetical protein
MSPNGLADGTRIRICQLNNLINFFASTEQNFKLNRSCKVGSKL